jgi:uncharacterized protein YhbP (UPF0306 family)
MSNQQDGLNWAREECINYVASYNVMSLATVPTSCRCPWIALVNYVFDKTTSTIYFISRPDSLHSTHMLYNNVVAIAITDTSQDLASSPHGLQGRGLVEQVVDGNVSHVQKIYAQVFPGYALRLSDEQDGSVAYSLTLTYCKLVDSRLSQEPLEYSFNDGKNICHHEFSDEEALFNSAFAAFVHISSTWALKKVYHSPSRGLVKVVKGRRAS